MTFEWYLLVINFFSWFFNWRTAISSIVRLIAISYDHSHWLLTKWFNRLCFFFLDLYLSVVNPLVFIKRIFACRLPFSFGYRQSIDNLTVYHQQFVIRLPSTAKQIFFSGQSFSYLQTVQNAKESSKSINSVQQIGQCAMQSICQNVRWCRC